MAFRTICNPFSEIRFETFPDHNDTQPLGVTKIEGEGFFFILFAL